MKGYTYIIMKPKKYKTKDGTEMWQFQIYLGKDLNGKRIIKKRQGFRTQADALIAYSKMLEDYKNGKFTSEYRDHKDMTVAQLYDEWLPKYRITVEPSTLAKTEYYFELHILPTLGDKTLESLTAPKLQDVANHWSMEAKSGWKWSQTLKRLLEYAELNGYLSNNPFRLVKKPKQVNTTKERKTENVLHTEQAKRFLEYWENQPIKQYAYFRLMLYSGIRRGEANALTWDDIDFKNHTLRINKSIGQGMRSTDEMYLKETKTGASNRIIGLDSTTLDILKAYKVTSNNKNGSIWPGISGWMDFHTPQRWLQKMRNNPNVDTDLKNVTIHGLRHSHATMIFEKANQDGLQAPIKAVQERLGHSEIELTLQIYTHVTEQEKQAISKILDSL